MYTAGPDPKRACITGKERSAALKHAHGADIAGHWDWIKTRGRLKSAAYRPGRAGNAAKYLSTRKECQLMGQRRPESARSYETFPLPGPPLPSRSVRTEAPEGGRGRDGGRPKVEGSRQTPRR